ncbi:Integrase/recombinase xerD homolog [uncultured Alphaproteobacteria bacterium]|uniref:Integrase/recombinase xerD homolog n=1 Tax=uncultured Alphaproteobacteria bacterium TaxID=91750 RepID=A0A212K023_9PROT|nr:Integrase/recombinase xerD homolog [uncultured Alphaproteobacteria bacterium]
MLVQISALTRDNSLLSESTISPPEAVSAYLEASISANTRRAYRCDMAHFTAWGGTIPATPEAVAQYLAEYAEALTVATLSRRLVAIGKAHTMQGLPNPGSSDLVRMTMRGIRRTWGKPQRQAAAAIKEDVLAMVGGMGTSVKDIRDRALILIGFAGAFRRSELVGLDVSDIEHVSQGIIIHLRRSKTDQDGRGRKVAIPFARGTVCAVFSLTAWLEAAGITEGPVFRPVDRHGHVAETRLSGKAVAVVVKTRAEAAGLDPARYSGHSLRAGLATSAAAAGVPTYKIRQQTGHASDAMLGRYIRDGGLFWGNVVHVLL